MERKSVLVMVIVLVCAGLAGIASAENWIRPHATAEQLGTSQEMLDPAYWIALQPDADEVIMTPAQIDSFNEHVRTKKVTFRDYYGRSDPLEREYALHLTMGLNMNPVLPLELPDTIPGDSLRVRFASNIEWLHSRDFYDGRNALFTDEMRSELEDAMNVGAIPDVIRRQWGIVTTHADIRLYPTSAPGYSEIRWEMDLFQATSLVVGNPVAILHRSKDGGFFYIESPIGKGWVDASDIAIGSRDELRRIVSAKDFLVATTHRVPIYGDPGFKVFSQYFYFAATVPLESKTAGAYVVSLPYRKHDGTLGTGRAFVRPDADVHVGWLPYTKRNVLTQIFNLLGQPYGWHSQQNKRDCAGTQRLLLRSFGIVTGRYTSYILNASDHMFYMNPKLTTEEKIAELDKLEPVITMTGNSGHIVLYLGKARNGKHYFMHQGGWGIKGADGTEYVVNRTALNDVENDWYSVNRPNVYTTMRP